MPFLMSLLQLNKLLQIQDACLGGLVLETLPPLRYFLLNIFTQCLSSLFWTSQAIFYPVLLNTLSHLKQTLYLVNFKDPIYKSLENHDPSIHENYDVYLLVVYSSF